MERGSLGDFKLDNRSRRHRCRNGNIADAIRDLLHSTNTAKATRLKACARERRLGPLRSDARDEPQMPL